MNRSLISLFYLFVFLLPVNAQGIANLGQQAAGIYIVPQSSEQTRPQEKPKVPREKQTSSGAGAQPTAEKSKMPETSKETAEELWQKAITAKGGLDALKAVKTWVATTQVTMVTLQENFTSGMTTIVSYPDKISTQLKMGDNTVYKTLAGDDFWLYNAKANQITIINGALSHRPRNAQAMQLKVALEGDPIALFVLASDAGSERTLLDPLEGMPGLTIKLKNGEVFKAFFNPQTTLLEKLVYSVDYYGEVVILFSDYRAVGGIQFPFKAETFRGTAKIGEQAVTDLKLNVAVPENTFVIPNG